MAAKVTCPARSTIPDDIVRVPAEEPLGALAALVQDDAHPRHEIHNVARGEVQHVVAALIASIAVAGA
jgi:hypothetical protein